MGSMYDDTPTSRFEEDMRAIIDGTPWPDRPPKSKMESLLEELNDLIKAGGGGGGGTSTIAWKPTVAADGTISWVRTASETKPEDQNIKGPKGDTGATGETGSQGPKGDDGDPGLGIKLVSIDQQNHLIITYDDNTTHDAGAIPGGGTTDYDDLSNKPQIGGVTLTGDKSASDLSLASTSRLADAENMVCAEFFDASKAYAKDTYVIYNDGLYKFKSAHTAGTAWDATIVDEVDLLTVIKEATNPTIDPPVLNKESVVSENDVNSLSASFTAQQTSAYMLILSICNSDSFPTLTSCTVSVNLADKTPSDYYASEEYGIASKYVLLNLEAGDSIAASIASSIDVYGTSASIMLVRLSNSINGLTLKDAEFSNNYTDPTLSFNVEKDAVYLLWFFNRSNGVGAFKTLKKNNANITSNKIICSSGSGWQVSHGMCMVYAKALDIFNVAIQFNGYFDAVGIFEVLMDTGESYNDLKDKPQIGGVTLSGNKSLSDLGIPTALASLTDDATHRTVTDTEKSTWNDKQSALPVTASDNDVAFAGKVTDGNGHSLSELDISPKSASGNPLTVTDALPYPALSLSADIEPIQDLHGLPFPYVGGAYKNKFNPNFTGVTGITPSVDSNGYLILTVSGAVSATFLKGQSIALKANTVYTLSCVGASANAKVSLRNSDGSTIYASVEVDGGSSTYTPTEDITVYFYIRVETSAALTATLKPQLEEGSNATSFVPYSNICPISGHSSVTITRTDAESQTADFTIQLGQTVYGADINWDTGVMTVDRVKVSKTWGQMDNATDLGSGVTRKLCNKGSIGTLLPASAESISNVCAYLGGGWNDPVIRWFHDDINAFFYLPSNTPNDLLCEWIAPLATPTTIQLTPEQLTMLKGYNRLSSDGGGDITLEYLPDYALNELYKKVTEETDTKIDSLDASDVDALPDSIIIASDFSEEVTYVKGKYVIYNGEIYRCKEYHAAGTWNASNFDPVTIGDEIFDAGSFNKFYGSANYDGTTEYKVDHSYVHQGSSNIPDYPSDGKAGTTNRFGILKTMRIDTGYIFQTLIVSYEGEPSGDDPTIKTKFYYRSAIRINGTYVWGNWYETTGTELT